LVIDNSKLKEQTVYLGGVRGNEVIYTFWISKMDRNNSH
jgi:hypothetical protein